MSNYVITIAREYGSGGKTIGRMLADELKIKYYDKDLIKLASEESGIDERFFNLVDEKLKGSSFKRGGVYKGQVLSPEHDDFVSDDNLFNLQAKVIKNLAYNGPCVIVGRCADYILREKSNVIKVFVFASRQASIKNIVDMYGVSQKEAALIIEKTNKARSDYYKYYTGASWEDARNYDLCLDSSRLGFDKCMDIIKSYIDIMAR